MSNEKFVNIVGLMTTYNFEIEELPDNLKCAKCKLVLKDACLVSCACRFCLVCINTMVMNGDKFCPGISEECRESSLSRYVSDYKTNKSVSKLTAKCPHGGCFHECQLVNMEKHLGDCQRKSVECPFRELGCTQNQLAIGDMDGHLQHEIRRHNEILIRTVGNITREIEMMKQRDGEYKREIEMLKYDLVRKDEQINRLIDQIINVENENKSIRREKEDLIDRVRTLSETIEREIDERRENDELDNARVIEHIDREIATITGSIGLNQSGLTEEIKLINENIQSINQETKSIKNDIYSMKFHVQSIQALVGLGQIDSRYEWMINDDLQNTRWYWGDRLSNYFTGTLHPYKYRLASWNAGSTADESLWIMLRIHAGPSDGKLAWPFIGRVVMTIGDKERREACRSIALHCAIERPMKNDCSWSNLFEFRHSELIGAGLDLIRGVRVSCVIVPGVGR